MSSTAALRHETGEILQAANVAAPPRKKADIVVLPKSVATTWRHPADMHKGVYLTALAAWGAFLSVFWVTFSMSGNALFILTICAFYAVVFFSLPVILTRLFPEKMPVRGAFIDFLRGDFSTIDGPISGHAALAQVIVVPVCLMIGGVAIGIAIHAARAAY